MKQLDMIGKPCPIPVVEAKKLLALPDTSAVEVLVDNIVAVQNLEKMAKGTGCVFTYEKDSDALYRVTIEKGCDTDAALAKAATALDTAAASAGAPAPAARREGPTVLITSQVMGAGSDDLGAILIKGFIFSLTELAPAPKAVIFLNGGAHLTTEGAGTVQDLKMLEAKGTEVLTCGTCANYYNLTEKLAVGGIADMMGITSRIAAAQNLISL